METPNKQLLPRHLLSTMAISEAVAREGSNQNISTAGLWHNNWRDCYAHQMMQCSILLIDIVSVSKSNA